MNAGYLGSFPAAIVGLPFVAAFAGLLLVRRNRRPAVDGGVRAHQNADVDLSSVGHEEGAAAVPAEVPDLGANRRAAWFAVVPTAVAAALAIWLAWSQGFAFFDRLHPEPSGPLVSGISTTYGQVDLGGISFSLTLEAGGLSAILGVLVTLVALAVQVYSIGYLK